MSNEFYILLTVRDYILIPLKQFIIPENGLEYNPLIIIL